VVRDDEGVSDGVNDIDAVPEDLKAAEAVSVDVIEGVNEEDGV
jgi:hypothetical protein